jgi:protein-disulfide isomerase
MTTSHRSQGTLPRHERRRIDLEERRAERPQRRTQRRGGRHNAWRSPMVLSTIAALAVGLAVITFAVLQQPAAPSAHELAHPEVGVPAALVDGRTLGKVDAPVTIDIWSDFQCPACRLFAVETEPSIVSTFVVAGTARLVYHDAAFQGQRGSNPAYDESVEAAAAARCAADQGKFWEMHNWIFANWNGENQGAFAALRLRAMAEGAGVSLATYDTCLGTGDMQSAARAETSQAVATGVSSTPTILINGQAYAGALTIAQLSQLIEQAAGTAH